MIKATLIPETDIQGITRQQELMQLFQNFRYYADKYNYDIDEENYYQIQKALSVFSENQKGLYIYGSVGTGKTKFMTILQKIFAWSTNKYQFLIYDVMDIVNTYQGHGSDGLNNIYGLINQPRMITLDDLGIEPTRVKFFGDETDVIADILLKRYRIYDSDKILTNVTSNYHPNQLLQRYGDRLFDRFQEMFVSIEFTGNSRRK